MELKRGFLNSDKGRALLEREDNAHIDHETAKDGDQDVQMSPKPGTSEGNDSCPPVQGSEPAKPSGSKTMPNALGGRKILVSREISAVIPENCQEMKIPIDLHAPPPGLEHPSDRKRFVFRNWPRATDGQPMKENPWKHGKKTSNGWPIWGETLYDFYHTARVPDIVNMATISSGSRLADAMREFGELDAAADEISWAESEGEPKEIFPYDIGELIREAEFKQDESAEPWPENPTVSPDIPTLQHRLPLHLLPERLVVHDYNNALTANAANYVYHDAKIERTFNLSLSSAGLEKRESERKKAEEEEKKRLEKEEDQWRTIVPDVHRPGPTKQFAILAKVPPRPPPPTSVPEAHLYIRRTNLAGTGNHSYVYHAILELPRRVLVKDVLCEDCFFAAVDAEIARLRAEGKLFPDGEEGKGGVVEFFPQYVNDRRNLSLVDFHEGCHGMRNGPSNIEKLSGQIKCIESETRLVVKKEYTGTTVKLEPKVEWQSADHGPMCEHLRLKSGNPTPTTARVLVCAKLSHEHDDHLVTEAQSYQSFPEFFFEHWTGYNVVYPLHDPTPVGAIVPQFYGYYKPEEASRSYISPILLVEECGAPIKVPKMTTDERHECAALYFHFMHADWAHDSIYERNLLVQPGPITKHPDKRKRKTPSFRLIDFGRARMYEEPREFISLKEEVLALFKLFHHE